jgi:dethiobiotin synthetase
MVLVACRRHFRFDVAGMKPSTLFVTGTDTGVGKTVLTALLAQFFLNHGVNVAALKPVCSGGRGDARKIYAAMNGVLPLDEINPWHFRAPIAPLLAARRESKDIKLSQVVAHLRAMQKRFDVLLVEGAGGLLSPLGEGFNSRDLILALRATPIIVAPNKLGVISHILLTLEALPKNLRKEARIIFTPTGKSDLATASNAELLRQFLVSQKISSLPRLGKNFLSVKIAGSFQVRRVLKAIV